MHKIAQLIIINNFPVESFNLRNKNVLLSIIIDIINHASDNESNFHYILNSQFENQKPLSNIDTNFNHTTNENENRENNALNDFTSQDENLRFENLTSI